MNCTKFCPLCNRSITAWIRKSGKHCTQDMDEETKHRSQVGERRWVNLIRHWCSDAVFFVLTYRFSQFRVKSSGFVYIFLKNCEFWVKSIEVRTDIDHNMLKKTGCGTQHDRPCKQRKTIPKIWRHVSSLGISLKSCVWG